MKIKIMSVFNEDVSKYLRVLKNYNVENKNNSEYIIELKNIEDIFNLVREIDEAYDVNSVIIETDDFHTRKGVIQNYRIVIYDDYYE